MAHAQKPDFVFRAKRTRPFKWARGRQFSRLLAAEMCASAVVMLDTPCSEVVWSGTGYQLHSSVSPSLPLLCITVWHHISTGIYRFSNQLICIQYWYKKQAWIYISLGKMQYIQKGTHCPGITVTTDYHAS